MTTRHCRGIGGGGLAPPAPPAPLGCAIAPNLLSRVLNQSNSASCSLGSTNHSLLHLTGANSTHKLNKLTSHLRQLKLGAQIHKVTMTFRIFLFIGFDL